LKVLGSVIKVRSKKKVQKACRRLVEEYKRRNTSLEVLELEGQRFVLQLKPDYSPRVKRLAKKPLLSIGPLKTLSYIAYRQPVEGKRVVEVRGRHAYSHIRLLAEMGLITTEKDARARIIRTTEYFADYFGLSHDLKKMKRQLRVIFGNLLKKEKNISEKAKAPK